MTGLKPGDEAVVLGDTRGRGHKFASGDKVTVIKIYSDDDHLLRCISDHKGGGDWWVDERDLKLLPSASDEEIEAAIRSIKTRETIVNTPRKHSPHFFNREPDGTVRLRIRFDPEEAALFEEAAGETPVMVWLHRTLEKEARRQVKEARRKRGKVDPPREGT